jgi:hypothetical protein
MQNKILFLLLGLLLIGFGSAWSEDAFNNSLTSENLTFVEEITCYQESANISNQTGIDGDCGLNYDGAYFITNIGDKWNDPENIVDGDWDTGADATIGTQYAYMNYTKPLKSISLSLWRFKLEDGTQDMQLLNSCWNYDDEKIILRLKSTAFGLGETSECFNGTWNVLHESTVGGDKLYEEAMIWSFGYSKTRYDHYTRSNYYYIW